MREIGANLGGEQSGHVVMFDHGTTGDGLATTLAILKLLQDSGQATITTGVLHEDFSANLDEHSGQRAQTD